MSSHAIGEVLGMVERFLAPPCTATLVVVAEAKPSRMTADATSSSDEDVDAEDPRGGTLGDDVGGSRRARRYSLPGQQSVSSSYESTAFSVCCSFEGYVNLVRFPNRAINLTAQLVAQSLVDIRDHGGFGAAPLFTNAMDVDRATHHGSFTAFMALSLAREASREQHRGLLVAELSKQLSVVSLSVLRGALGLLRASGGVVTPMPKTVTINNFGGGVSLFPPARRNGESPIQSEDAAGSWSSSAPLFESLLLPCQCLVNDTCGRAKRCVSTLLQVLAAHHPPESIAWANWRHVQQRVAVIESCACPPTLRVCLGIGVPVASASIVDRGQSSSVHALQCSLSRLLVNAAETKLHLGHSAMPPLSGASATTFGGSSFVVTLLLLNDLSPDVMFDDFVRQWWRQRGQPLATATARLPHVLVVIVQGCVADEQLLAAAQIDGTTTVSACAADDVVESASSCRPTLHVSLLGSTSREYTRRLGSEFGILPAPSVDIALESLSRCEVSSSTSCMVLTVDSVPGVSIDAAAVPFNSPSRDNRGSQVDAPCTYVLLFQRLERRSSSAVTLFVTAPTHALLLLQRTCVERMLRRALETLVADEAVAGAGFFVAALVVAARRVSSREGATAVTCLIADWIGLAAVAYLTAKARSFDPTVDTIADSRHGGLPVLDGPNGEDTSAKGIQLDMDNIFESWNEIAARADSSAGDRGQGVSHEFGIGGSRHVTGIYDVFIPRPPLHNFIANRSSASTVLLCDVPCWESLDARARSFLASVQLSRALCGTFVAWASRSAAGNLPSSQCGTFGKQEERTSVAFPIISVAT